MSSLVQANEEVLDFNSINPKLPLASKAFTFFVYYERQVQSPQSTLLQKMTFALRKEKNEPLEKGELGKSVQLNFVDLDNESEVEQSFFELRIQILQSPKTKLIFYAQEHRLLGTITHAKAFGIDLTHVPSALYSPDLHEDLAQHLGWREPLLGDLSRKNTLEFQDSVNKWITSPGERIDVWSATFSVDPQHGSIERLDSSASRFALLPDHTLTEHFISHLSLGHHAELAANYEASRKEVGASLTNRVLFGLESFKKFCCLGSPSLEASTGVVEVLFSDEKGNSHEVSKQLVRESSRRGILSLVLANIDKFMGIKLAGGRLNDSQIEMGVCEASSDFRLIGSASGEVRVALRAEQAFLAVGSSCFRLRHPRDLRISLWGKVKLLISKDTLQC